MKDLKTQLLLIAISFTSVHASAQSLERISHLPSALSVQKSPNTIKQIKIDSRVQLMSAGGLVNMFKNPGLILSRHEMGYKCMISDYGQLAEDFKFMQIMSDGTQKEIVIPAATAKSNIHVFGCQSPDEPVDEISFMISNLPYMDLNSEVKGSGPIHVECKDKDGNVKVYNSNLLYFNGNSNKALIANGFDSGAGSEGFEYMNGNCSISLNQEFLERILKKRR